MAMSGSGSTIVRRSADQPFAAAYEAHNVFITSLPEVLLFHMHQRTAEKVYQEWQECEVTIGKRPRRAMPLVVMPAVGGRSSSSTMFDQPLAVIASRWRQ